MCVNKYCIFTVFICASILSSRAYYIDTDTDTSALENERVSTLSTTRDVLSWTPGKLKKKVNIGGQNVYFRVKDGTAAHAGQFPYQISFRRQVGNSHWFVNFCGGSLIDKKAVLTAAHCFRDPKPCDACCMDGFIENNRIFHVYAVAGTEYSMSHFHGNNDTEEYGQWRLLKSGYFPKNFKFPDNDIAIVFTTLEFIYNDKVQPIPLPSKRSDYSGKICYISGYGKTPEGQRMKFLQFAEMRVMKAKACNKVHGRKMDKGLCSSDEYSGITKGDAGGPLVCKETGDPNENAAYGLLVGVAVTADKKTAKEGSLFTQVFAYKDLIQQKLKSDSSQPQLSWAVLTFALISFIFQLIFGNELLML